MKHIKTNKHTLYCQEDTNRKELFRDQVSVFTKAQLGTERD